MPILELAAIKMSEHKNVTGIYNFDKELKTLQEKERLLEQFSLFYNVIKQLYPVISPFSTIFSKAICCTSIKMTENDMKLK